MSVYSNPARGVNRDEWPQVNLIRITVGALVRYPMSIRLHAKSLLGSKPAMQRV
jgi:hypothetical protein